MTGKTHKIRRTLTAMVLSATAALIVVPLAQARLDDYATSIGREPQATQTKDHILDVSARDAALVPASNPDHILDVSARDAVLVPASNPNDHILDVSARDTVQAPSSTPDLRGDYMFQQYFRNAAKSSDHVLDVSARDSRTPAAIVSDPNGGTDWGEIGIGIALTLGGVLLLGALVAVGFEVRHSRRPLRNA